jgi:TP901 family phage tail tape measure protein
MSDEIKQVLGFDVADGISNLEKFGQSLSNVSGRLTRFGTTLDKFNARFSSTPAAFNASANAADRMTASVERLTTNAGRLTTSVELLSRIVFTQLVIKGLRVAETAMSDAAGRAADLQLKLADIATISGKTFSGLSDIGAAVEDLSRHLGTDQLAVAEGLYTAIGNQIGGTKDELIAFNRVAGEFATATLTGQADAMKLLSGVLNSYSIDVSRAEEVASKFNRAIDLGSISGREFATQFGRVAPQAAILGVSLDEVLASFSTLTRNGLSASEAATRLTGVISGLQKPSEDLEAILKRLNVSSGEGLVRASGFAGALKQIAQQTDGSSKELSEVFHNVRGLAGELILGSQKADAFASDLDKITNTARSLNKERFNIVFNTDAKKTEVELNKFRIELTKLGEELLHGTAQAFDFVGGADAITKAAKITAPAIAALAVASATYAANSRLAVLQGSELAGVLGKLAKFGVGAGVALSLSRFIGSELDSSRFTKLKELEAASDRSVQKFISGETDRLEAARKTDDKIVESALDASRAQVQAFNDANAALLADQNRVKALVSGDIKQVIQTREDFVRELERAADDSFKAIEQSQRRIADLKFSQEQRTFDQSLIGVSDTDKFQRTLQRSVELAERAGSALKRAQSGSQIGDAERLFDTAKRTAESAQQLASRLNDRKLENAAAFTLNKLTDDQISAERQLQSLQERRLKLSDSEADKERAVTDELKASQKALLDTLNIVGSNPADLAKLAGARSDALQRISGAGFDKGDVNLANSLGLTKLAQEMQRNPIPITLDVDSAVERLTAGVQNAFKDFKLNVNIDVAGLEAALKRELRTPDEIAAGLADAKKEADALRTSLSKISQDRKEALTGVKDEVRETLNDTKTLTNAASRAGGSFLGIDPADVARGTQLIREASDDFTRLAQSASVTKEQIAEVFSKVGELDRIQQTMSGRIFGSGGGFAPDIEALSKVAERLLQVANMPTVDPQQTARLQQLETVIQGSQSAATNIETALINGASAAKSALMEGADYLASRLAETVSRLSSKPANFASGGLARGTDTVPAMLSRGEFVVNANSSRRFFSDLQRMNAGMEPTYRGDGGTVVNNTGDVNIAVDGSKSPTATGREVWKQIQREFRKGTIRK